MIEIKDLLGRFNNLLLKGEMKKAAIKDVIFLVVGIKIASEDISIKNNTIFLNVKPIYKNEIFIKQEEIFNQLSKMLNKKTPERIR
jgi:hypothetical protein